MLITPWIYRNFNLKELKTCYYFFFLKMLFFRYFNRSIVFKIFEKKKIGDRDVKWCSYNNSIIIATNVIIPKLLPARFMHPGIQELTILSFFNTS